MTILRSLKLRTVWRPENAAGLRLWLSVGLLLGVVSVCLATGLASWSAFEGPIRQYPNSTTANFPSLAVPAAQIFPCPALTAIVLSTYTTSDSPERVMSWYTESRREYVNQGKVFNRAGARYEFGPLKVGWRRTPALSIAGYQTQILITTDMNVQLCP